MNAQPNRKSHGVHAPFDYSVVELLHAALAGSCKPTQLNSCCQDVLGCSTTRNRVKQILQRLVPHLKLLFQPFDRVGRSKSVLDENGATDSEGSAARQRAGSASDISRAGPYSW